MHQNNHKDLILMTLLKTLLDRGANKHFLIHFQRHTIFWLQILSYHCQYRLVCFHYYMMVTELNKINLLRIF